MDYGKLKQLIGKGIRSYVDDAWTVADGTKDAAVQLTNGDIYGMASSILDMLMKEGTLPIETDFANIETVRLAEFGR